MTVPDRQISPPPQSHLGSNNPFRNRALSPPSDASRSGGKPDRPVSRNPFLDDSTTDKPDVTGNTRELFENLSLDRSAPVNGRRPAPSRPDRPSQRPPPNGRPPVANRDRLERRDRDPMDVFADPVNLSKTTSNTAGRDRTARRPQRRNSESSVIDRKVMDADDERRRRERRHRERHDRHKDGRSRSSKKPNARLDIIDKLDVTGIYGTGMFHHDGPFDACNPHRNRKGMRTAPMQAFPKDSSNMALGGSGPLNDKIDLDRFHGRGAEGWNDYAASGIAETRKPETTGFDPTARVEQIHGAPSMGLGTSTFLEGAPASRAAIQRRQSENEAQMLQNGGLQRKKSLAQRIRGINSRRADGRMMSPEPRYTPPLAGSSHSASGRLNERNPFFNDYDDAWDKKGAKIQLAEETPDEAAAGRPRSVSSPKQNTALERSQTGDRSHNAPEDSNKPSGGGFINRMKSLRKPRPEPRVSND